MFRSSADFENMGSTCTVEFYKATKQPDLYQIFRSLIDDVLNALREISFETSCLRTPDLVLRFLQG